MFLKTQKELKAYVFEIEFGFGYLTFLGEIICDAYVTWRHDIAYVVTIISKFSSVPSTLHHSYLKYLAKYLYIAQELGYHLQSHIHSSWSRWCKLHKWCVTLDGYLPIFLVNITHPNLLAFVDTTYTNDLQNQSLQLVLYSVIMMG